MLKAVMKSFAPPRAFRRFALALVATLGMLTIVSACYRNSDPDDVAEQAPPTYLKVQNQAFLDMTMYVIRNSQRIRLGTVTGNTTGRLLIPNNLLFNGNGTLQFMAAPIGGNRTPISQEISVSAGDEVMLTIPPG